MHPAPSPSSETTRPDRRTMEATLLAEGYKVLGLTSLSPPAERLFRRVIALDGIGDLYDEMNAQPAELTFYERLRRAMRLQLDAPDEQLARIPATGPAVVVGNHPFGMLEGVILGSLLPRVRPDWKVMTIGLMAAFPEIRHQYILVDPFGTAEAQRANLQGMRESLQHLKRGGLLVIFPAGAVAHLRWGETRVSDSPWVPNMGRIIRSAKATVVPMRIFGRNSNWYQALGLLHPLIRTAMLGRELLNKRGRTIRVRVGEALAPDTVQRLADDAALMAELRARVESLQR